MPQCQDPTREPHNDGIGGGASQISSRQQVLRKTTGKSPAKKSPVSKIFLDAARSYRISIQRHDAELGIDRWASRVRLMVARGKPFINGAMDRIGRAMCEDPLERALSTGTFRASQRIEEWSCDSQCVAARMVAISRARHSQDPKGTSSAFEE